ncbi:MAG: hypothetical protein K0Q95_2230 [Bacteroidota bacterium]|jgi:hypothetical protein|nr:hypothetical protein [Bacteroidota bacterium]
MQTIPNGELDEDLEILGSIKLNIGIDAESNDQMTL